MAKKKSSKKQPKREVVEKKEEKDVEFEFRIPKISFNNKYVKYAIPILMIIIVMWVAALGRVGPVSLDGLEERIEANTLSNIRNIIVNDVRSEFPNLNDVYREQEIEKRFALVIETRKVSIQGQEVDVDQIVAQNVNNVKSSFQADNGQTYLNAIDPYFFLRKSDNLFKTGTIGDVVIDGVGYETQQLAPKEAKVNDASFHMWLGAQLFKMNGLTPESDIGEKIKAIYLIPLIFAVLSIIPCFLIIREFTDDIYAFFGALVLSSIGTFVSRTVAGFVDTDAYNVFFPLFIVLFISYGVLVKKRLLAASFFVLAGLVQGLYLWAWGSAWFIFFFSLVALMGYFSYIILANILETKSITKIHDKKILEVGLGIILFTVFSNISSYIFTKSLIFNKVYEGVFAGLSGIASISQVDIWPNVYSSVAELNPASFGTIIGGVGGKVIFIIALLGLVLLSLDFKPKDRNHLHAKRGLIVFSIIWFYLIVAQQFLVSLAANNALIYMIVVFMPVGIGILLGILNKSETNKVFMTFLLTIWIAGTIFMSLNGIRFILLLAPAFAIAFAIGLSYMGSFITNLLKKEFKFNKEGIYQKLPSYVVLGMLFFFLYSPLYAGATNISKGTVPNFDDNWFEAMENLKNNSEKDTIITSWWDFGHFFATVSERGVTFDGGSQTTPRSHWVGRLLMENDERVAVDMLRMLVCGGNEAHNTMLGISGGTEADGVKINKIIYETFGKDKEGTREVIEENSYYEFTQSQVDEIMENLFCDNPPQNVVVASGDMIGKGGVWAHWGSWDFTKKYVLNNYGTKSASEIAQDIDENISLIENHIAELRSIDARSKSENVKREDLINRWFAPYPSYLSVGGSYQNSCSPQSDEIIICGNGIAIINFTSGLVSGPVMDQNNEVYSLVYPAADGSLEETIQNPGGSLNLVLAPRGDGSASLLVMNSPLGRALFTKLYFFNGYGTQYFDLMRDSTGANGNRLMLWNTNWTRIDSIEN